jgi:hypothetical protein
VLSYTFTAKLWLYDGQAAWHFVTLPKGLAAELKGFFAGERRGFGSLPVEVTVGKTTWRTSIFPDSKSGSYVLPVKAQVRKAEGLREGQRVQIKIDVRA